MSDWLSVPDSQKPQVQAEGLALASASSSRQEQFLRLRLTHAMTALLSIDHISEIISLPGDQIWPIPHMPAWVMGVYNWRSEVLWVVDLSHRCGLEPWYQQSSHISVHAAVALKGLKTGKFKDCSLGLVVNQVEDMEWCDPTAIQLPPVLSLPLELATFLRGYWWNSDNEMLAVLDGQSIIESIA
jgi:positive phototaxis protein PixI